MLAKKVLNFTKGLKDGLPIALGYLTVSFAFGIVVMSYESMPVWAPILTSITNLTGTGQAIGMEMLNGGAALLEIAFTMVVINIRYVLMSISISQRLKDKTGTFARLAISFGVTDEIYVVSMNQNSELNFKYMMGLILGSFLGWVTGTVLGSLIGSYMPSEIKAATGITIYAMFIAIVVPPAKESKPILVTVLVSVIISSLLNLMMFLLKNNNTFFIVLVAGILSTIVATILFPVRDDIDTDNNVECEKDELDTVDDTKFDNIMDEITSSDSTIKEDKS